MFEKEEEARPDIEEGSGTETEGASERKVDTMRSSSLRLS